MGRPKASAASSPAKRKNAKAVKDPNKPKRPTSAYFYYAASEREIRAKAGNRVTKVADFTKEVSQKWRALTNSEKAPFEKKAAQDKDRYVKEMAQYTGKDPNKPKRPQTAYFLFLADFRKDNKDDYAENKELLRGAGEAWKDLSAAERKPYDAAAVKEKAKYEDAMAEYNKSGRSAVPAKKAKMEANGASEEDEDDDEEEDEEEEEDDE